MLKFQALIINDKLFTLKGKLTKNNIAILHLFQICMSL